MGAAGGGADDPNKSATRAGAGAGTGAGAGAGAGAPKRSDEGNIEPESNPDSARMRSGPLTAELTRGLLPPLWPGPDSATAGVAPAEATGAALIEMLNLPPPPPPPPAEKDDWSGPSSSSHLTELFQSSGAGGGGGGAAAWKLLLSRPLPPSESSRREGSTRAPSCVLHIGPDSPPSSSACETVGGTEGVAGTEGVSGKEGVSGTEGVGGTRDDARGRGNDTGDTGGSWVMWVRREGHGAWNTAYKHRGHDRGMDRKSDESARMPREGGGFR